VVIAANQTLRFLLELAALAALVYWGLRTGASFLADVLLAVAAPLAFATLWGLLAAPRAPRRLRDPWRMLFEAIAFALTAGALVAADQERLGGIFLVVALLNALAVRALGEPGATGRANSTLRRADRKDA
jgi:Protein of unknown function (DUF2568)